MGLRQIGSIAWRAALKISHWFTSGNFGILSDTSLFGRVLHTLVGYADEPSILQVLVYLATLAAIFTLSKIFSPRRPSTGQLRPASPACSGAAAKDGRANFAGGEQPQPRRRMEGAHQPYMTTIPPSGEACAPRRASPPGFCPATR